MKLFSTSCEAVYLGWDAPLLPRAVATLRQRYAEGDRLDLGRLICVLPSAWSVRRLDALLRDEVETHPLRYTAPQIITVGQLPEQLYQSKTTLALEFEQTLAWARVLRQVHANDLQPLISVVPAAEPIGPWIELAGTLRRLHEELSSNRLTFAEVSDGTETEAEQRRWRLLSQLFERYQAELQQAGLADPHWARREAANADRCCTDRAVVLIGTSDLSEALIAMLRSLDSEIVSLVAAPPDQSARFDEFGCVDTPAWINHHLPLADTQLIAAGDIADQATAVAETVADFATRFSADQVTVGVTDESHVGPVAVELRGCGVSTYRNLGWTINQTAVGRLLNLTATYLQRRSWQSLAALVRHADVCKFVSEQWEQTEASDWLTQLDKLLADHFPVRVRDPLPPKAIEQYPLAASLGGWLEQWLGVFSGPDQTIAAWSEVIVGWLSQLYEREIAPDRRHERYPAAGSRTEMAFAAVKRLLSRFADLNDGLDLALSGGAAIEMLAGRLSDARVIDVPSPADVEILGWLDLSLDDAPAMVVMGLNHPFVPGSITSDPFLPGALRTKLRMSDNDRRFARDVYAMHLMLSARRDIRFIVGSNGADGSPTPPSRLLAAAPTTDAARRIRHLLGGRRTTKPVQHRWDVGSTCGVSGDGQHRTLPIPTIEVAAGRELVKTMSVTAFRDYLACPYRFYLRHVLKLKPLDDASSELAANQFGDLVHAALERFGESADRNQSDRSQIEAALLAHLHDYAAEYYGDASSTAVSLQIAQAERRLKAVANAQAERAAAGWLIHASEASVSEQEGAGVMVDGKKMGLRGRFDRIDHHPQSNRWAILDYKTHGHKPEKKHLKVTDQGVQWIDLQLPLYRMMIPFLGIDVPPVEVELGYFNVSEKDDETRINIAEFSEPLMRQAEDLIHDCIRRIRAGDFTATDQRVEFDDYAMILQTGIASRLLDQAEASFGEEPQG